MRDHDMEEPSEPPGRDQMNRHPEIHRFLVTADTNRKIHHWSATATFVNWIEGRDNGDRETWLVTCYEPQVKSFLNTAKTIGVTVQKIHDAGDRETYELLVGNPGTGWPPCIRPAHFDYQPGSASSQN